MMFCSVLFTMCSSPENMKYMGVHTGDYGFKRSVKQGRFIDQMEKNTLINNLIV